MGKVRGCKGPWGHHSFDLFCWELWGYSSPVSSCMEDLWLSLWKDSDNKENGILQCKLEMQSPGAHRTWMKGMVEL